MPYNFYSSFFGEKNGNQEPPYEAEDKEKGAVNIPHFLRAETKVKQLELSGRLNSVYDDMRKGKPCMI